MLFEICIFYVPLYKLKTRPRPARFRFENFRVKFPHFQETVQHAWTRPVQHACPFVRLKRKMIRVAQDLCTWSKSLFGKARMQFHVANEVILRLDMAQETRRLTEAKYDLRKMLKVRVLGLAAIDRARKRQASRIRWLRASDANSKLFHAKICSRRRKNHIHSITTADGKVLTEHTEKEASIHAHFTSVLGTKQARTTSLL